MMPGYSNALYILPFDHRASFTNGMFGWTGALSAEQTGQIAASKRVIYDGFRAALAGGVAKENAGILVDEQFGADILVDAKTNGCITCASAEKSGLDEFEFEFGSEFARHIERFAPSFCKVLVRYNPAGDTAMNRRQSARLRQLSEYLEKSSSRFMFELLVAATPTQLDSAKADQRVYDVELRPALMIGAIRELQDAGVEPDVWKVEGLERRSEYEGVADAVQRGGRCDVGCIVLGRAQSPQVVRDWLATAASVGGFIGFAVGRTTFWDSLVALRDGQITRDAAVAEIARRYRQWVDVFEQAQTVTVES